MDEKIEESRQKAINYDTAQKESFVGTPACYAARLPAYL